MELRVTLHRHCRCGWCRKPYVEPAVVGLGLVVAPLREEDGKMGRPRLIVALCAYECSRQLAAAIPEGACTISNRSDTEAGEQDEPETAGDALTTKQART